MNNDRIGHLLLESVYRAYGFSSVELYHAALTERRHDFSAACVWSLLACVFGLGGASLSKTTSPPARSVARRQTEIYSRRFRPGPVRMSHVKYMNIN